MKTVTIAKDSGEIGALLEQERDEDVILRLDDVSKFMLSAADDFDGDDCLNTPQLEADRAAL